MAKVEQVNTNTEPVVARDFSGLTQDPFEKAENLFKSNIRLIGYVAGGVIAVGAAVVFFLIYLSDQNDEAQKAIFPAVYSFEEDSLKRALNGNGNVVGLTTVADDYGMTNTGKQAEFYIGTSYLKLGKYEDAIEHLEKFNAGDALVQARAYSLLGDANLELKKYEDAANWYKKAAEHKPNKEFTPTYLLKLALAQELANNFTEAAATYGKLADEYPTSQEAADAKKLKARAETQSK